MSGKSDSSLVRSVVVYSGIIGVALVATLVLGEAFLRMKYSEGLSFANHFGPLVARFERDFQFNRYDGPSRGPEVVGEKGKDEIRLLVQGDSITWGQGVKDERSLYTSGLLERLRSVFPNVGMAVLARAGRNIDGHVAQLHRWGAAIDPDIVVYQWYVNDIDIYETNFPTKDRGWRKWIFPRQVIRRSYLWYFLDYMIQSTEDRASYADYIRENFNSNTEGWDLFVEYFRAWAAEAKLLTPNVVVVLYPHVAGRDGDSLLDFHAAMKTLCDEEGVAVVDLAESFEDFRADPTQLYASPFDGHPNAIGHARVADVLFEQIRGRWPNLYGSIADE